MSDSIEVEQAAASEPFVPDVYYFPAQVAWELDDIQSNILGKILTLIDALALEEKQAKAVKDLVRTVVKEQMIKTRRMLDDRLNTVLRSGMKPIETGQSYKSFFFQSHVVTAVYEEKDMGEPGLR